MSNRVFKNQFSDGTTVDGSRLQECLDEIENRVNNIPAGDIKTRYLQQTIHCGFANIQALSVQYPWQNMFNEAADVVGGSDEFVVNPRRLKGCYNPDVSPAGATQYEWQTNIAFRKPVVIRAIHINMLRDSVYDYVFGSDNDIHFIMSVDNDGEKFDRHLNSYDVVKHLINDSSHPFRRTNNTAPAVDMFPPHTENIDGNIISFDNLEVNIPAGAAVRFAVVIPSGIGAWDVTSYKQILPGLTVHFDEEILDG